MPEVQQEKGFLGSWPLLGPLSHCLGLLSREKLVLCLEVHLWDKRHPLPGARGGQPPGEEQLRAGNLAAGAEGDQGRRSREETSPEGWGGASQ